MPGEVAVLYDEACGFCRWSVGALLAWDRDRRLTPVAIQSPEGARRLAALEPAPRLASAHAIGPDGVVHSGGDALAVVAAALPAGTPLAALARRLPGAARAGYGFVAGRRTRLGRLVGPGARAAADRRIAARQPR